MRWVFDEFIFSQAGKTLTEQKSCTPVEVLTAATCVCAAISMMTNALDICDTDDVTTIS